MTDKTTEVPSDETLGKIYGALEQAYQSNEIDVASLTRTGFVEVAKRAFATETEEPTRQLALVEDAAGDRFIRVTADVHEDAPWAAQDEGYFHSWRELAQPVLVVSRGVSAERLERWEKKARDERIGEVLSSREASPMSAPYAVPVEHRTEGRDL